MTGPTPPSFPTPSPTSAGSGVAGKCRKPTDFRRKFPPFVLRRSAAIFGNQDFPAMDYRFGHPRAAGALCVCVWAGENVARPNTPYVAGCVPTYVGSYDCVWAGENIARPSVEVARVVGVAGVLTDPIRGRVRPVV
ncbi:unnamed protein product [Prunus brigantina]